MRKIFALTAFLFFAFASFGQILTPVKWSFESKQISDTEFDLIFTAKIDDGWTIYSQFLDGEDGPVPTTFFFDDKEKHYSKMGKVEESPENRKTQHDDIFDMEVTKFYKKATFTQRVKVTADKPITGFLEFMTCDATKCLPPAEVDFSFSVSSKTDSAEKTNPTSTGEVAASTQKNEQTVSEEIDAAEESTEADHDGSEIFDPVKWSIGVEKVNETDYNVAFEATVQKGWYVYSQFIEEGGPEPTAIELDPSENATNVGQAEEISDHTITGSDEMFDDMVVTKFKEEVTFVQKIRVKDASQEVTGLLWFMTCDNARCLPSADVPFKINPAAGTAIIGADASNDMATDETAGLYDIKIDKSQVAECGVSAPAEKEGKGLLNIFILGFLGGLVALLTPCVFPMIPLTVSFFTKGSENKSKGMFNAFMYGFYILLVYVLLSLPFHLLDSVNPDILNEISTNVWLNIFFFVIFLFFAFSFFGYYELTLPSSWLNKSSSAEGVGGAIGIFFMALTL